MKPQRPEPSKSAQKWRKLLIPLASGWVFFICAAPLMLIDERIGLIALAAGFVVGLAVVLFASPEMLQQGLPTDSIRVRPQRDRLPAGHRLMPTVAALTLAAFSGYYLATNSLKDRGPLVIFAAVIIIALVRRPLRMAWGVNGSVAGIAISGALIVLLIRSFIDLPKSSPLLVISFSAIPLMITLYDEWQSLKRHGFFEHPEPPSEQGASG